MGPARRPNPAAATLTASHPGFRQTLPESPKILMATGINPLLITRASEEGGIRQARYSPSIPGGERFSLPPAASFTEWKQRRVLWA